MTRVSFSYSELVGCDLIIELEAVEVGKRVRPLSNHVGKYVGWLISRVVSVQAW